MYLMILYDNLWWLSILQYILLLYTNLYKIINSYVIYSHHPTLSATRCCSISITFCLTDPSDPFIAIEATCDSLAYSSNKFDFSPRMSSMLTSMLSSVNSRYTTTFRDCPIRYARLIACSSVDGFHCGSHKTIMFAACILSPTPPA